MHAIIIKIFLLIELIIILHSATGSVFHFFSYARSLIILTDHDLSCQWREDRRWGGRGATSTFYALRNMNVFFSILGSQITTHNSTKFPIAMKKMTIIIMMMMMMMTSGLMTVSGLTTMTKQMR